MARFPDLDLSELDSDEGDDLDSGRSPSRRNKQILLTKRVLLSALLLILPLSYLALTNSRYSGQGLSPKYLQLSTVGDVVSLLTFILTLIPVIFGLVRPHRISLGRTIISTAFSLIILWIEFGLGRFDASDFSATSSVVLITGIFVQLAILFTHSQPSASGIGRTWRVVRNTLLVFLLYSAFGFLFSFAYPSVTDPQEITDFRADVGVVFGAAVWSGKNLGNRPSPTLKARIAVGYDLLSAKAIPRLAVTGASAPGEQAEATVAKQEFIKLGVDPSAIIPESNSHSTFDQVKFIRDELKAKQGWSKFVVISDQYHLARVLEMCKFNHINAIGTPSHIKQPFLELAFYRGRESIALLAYWLLGK
jgi:uncharacterized SAM-binding protein YcdF (DUF218 family)